MGPKSVPAKQSSFFESIGAAIWARRWKLLATAFGVALVKACAWGPEWLQPGCELLAQLAKVLP